MPCLTLTDTTTGNSKSALSIHPDGMAQAYFDAVRHLPLMHDVTVVPDAAGDLVVTDETGAEVGRFTATITPRAGVTVRNGVTTVDAATPKQLACIQRLVREHGHLGRGFDLARMTKREASEIISSYTEEGCRGFGR